LDGIYHLYYKKITPLIDEKKLINLLDHYQKDYKKIIKKTDRAFCKSISSIVALVLEKYGYKSSIHFVRFIMGNQEAQFIFEQYGLEGLGEIISRNLYPDAYTIGCGFSDNPNDVHCVTKVGRYGKMKKS
jgi:hypothetical protein